MKLSVSIGALVSLVLITGSANAAKMAFAAEATGRREVKAPVDVADLDDVKGGAIVVYDDQTKILCGRIQYDDTATGYGALTGAATGIHIHQAPSGKPNDDGPAEQKIIIPVKAKEVTFKATIPAAWATSLVAGEVYVNLHTAKNTTGEARGPLDRFEDGDAFECDANAPMLQIGAGGAADAGAGDGGSTSSSTSSSGGADTSSSSSSSSSSGDNKSSSNGGLEKPAEEKPKADSGGCNTSSSTPENLLGLSLLGALAAAVIARAKKKKK